MLRSALAGAALAQVPALAQHAGFDKTIDNLPRVEGLLEVCLDCVSRDPGPGPPWTFCWTGVDFTCAPDGGAEDCADVQEPDEASRDYGSSCSAYICYDPQAFSCPLFHECWGASDLDGDEQRYACFLKIGVFQGPALMVTFALLAAAILSVAACVKVVSGSRDATEEAGGAATSAGDPFVGPHAATGYSHSRSVGWLAPQLASSYGSPEELRAAALGALNLSSGANAALEVFLSIGVLHFAVIGAGPKTMWLSSAPLLVALALRLLVLVVCTLQIGCVGRATRLHLISTIFTLLAAFASGTLMAATGSDSRTWLFGDPSFAPPGNWSLFWIPALAHFVGPVFLELGMLGWPTSEVALEGDVVKARFSRIRASVGFLRSGNAAAVGGAASWSEDLQVSQFVATSAAAS